MQLSIEGSVALFFTSSQDKQIGSRVSFISTALFLLSPLFLLLLVTPFFFTLFLRSGFCFALFPCLPCCALY
jgi:hypothetical protein